MDKIRIGVIGLGRIASLHLPAYKPDQHLNAELVAICDKNKTQVAEVAKEYNLSKTYTNYEEMLKDNSIDAVEILTPHHLHTEMTVKALRAGKHVSLQKAPCLLLSEMDRMIDAANQSHRWFRVFENFRFYDPYMKAMEIIKSGAIGTVDRVDYNMVVGDKLIDSWQVPLSAWAWRISEKSNYRSPIVFDDGYHKHSMMAQFLDESIVSVMAWQGLYRTKTVFNTDTPTVITYICKAKNRYGVWNVSDHDFVPFKSKYYGCDEWVEIFGSKGAVWIPGCTGSMFDSACSPEAPIKAGVHWIGEKDTTWHSITDLPTDWASSFINCSREFVDAIRSDRQPEVNPKTARYILQIALACLTSLRNNFRQVKLKEITDGIVYDHGKPPIVEETNEERPEK